MITLSVKGERPTGSYGSYQAKAVTINRRA